MSLPFLSIPPDSDGYRILDGDEIVNSGNYTGGASRQRQDFLGATSRCDVRWTCGPAAYEYIRAFFRTLGKGAAPFQVNLIFERRNPVLYTAQFVPGTFGLLGQSGMTYILGTTLEVKPQPIDAAFDIGLVAVFSSYGEQSQFTMYELSVLVNVCFQ